MLNGNATARRTQRGFSLVELALGMLILSIVLGALLRPLANQVAQQKFRQTEEDLEHIRDALYGFAMANGRLPRPAVSEQDGREAEACPATPGCSGFVPYATLGVPRGDAYGKLYMYNVTTRYTQPQPALSFADAGVWSIQTRTDAEPGKLVPLADKIVAVVRSFGARSFGRSIHGANVANESAGNVDELFNSGTVEKASALESLTFRHRPLSTQDNAAWGGAYDDQMIWISTSLYAQRMVQAGRMP